MVVKQPWPFAIACLPYIWTIQVEMELLGREDGWVRLDMLSAEELSHVQPDVLAALEHVHALRLPNGGSVVLADCRPCNVMVK